MTGAMTRCMDCGHPRSDHQEHRYAGGPDDVETFCLRTTCPCTEFSHLRESPMPDVHRPIDITAELRKLRVRLTDVTGTPMYDIDLTGFNGPAVIHNDAQRDFGVQVSRVPTYRGIEVPGDLDSQIGTAAFRLGVDRTLDVIADLDPEGPPF